MPCSWSESRDSIKFLSAHVVPVILSVIRRVPRVRLLCHRGCYAGVAAVWLRLLALCGDPPRLIAVLFTVLRTLGTEPQCALPLLLLLLLQQWSRLSPT
ncbi:hypothetical protein EYF80_012727 [Liparis tanakae]|uniref:Uncharacterized protein n=1 Tax=Liparis tanakae TaxID=230148 RepID=A0A4Z2IGE7_9TELE|nr:hypothetical protein EYF80_012727 [Liparis tanakae]